MFKRIDPERLRRREAPAARAISLVAQVDPHTLQTSAGDYLQTFELEGVAHETASVQEIGAWHTSLCGFIRNIASPNVALWSYLVREPLAGYPAGDFAPGYAADLNRRYRQHVERTGHFGTRLVLAVLYRPNPTRLSRLGSRVDRLSRESLRALQQAAVERLNGIERDVLKFLGRWSPRRLGVYERNALVFSEPLEFYGYLVNGYWQPMPLRRADIGETLMTARALFGRETFELRGPERSLFGAVLEFKEFPDAVSPGCLDELLRINAACVLVQSFAFVERTWARGAIERQVARLRSTEDAGLSQQDDLEQARDDLTSNRYAMGMHHITLALKTGQLESLPGIVAEARQAMAAGGGVVTRAGLELEAAFWSLLPGAFSKRPRPGLLGSRQWAALNAMHAYPTGKPDGNRWGPAVALFRTANGGPFFFSLHRGDVGHFCVLGATGSGKTVLMMFLVAMLSRLGVQVTYFDLFWGAEMAIHAFGGHYFRLDPGQPSGFAPFALKQTEANVQFVQTLMRTILRNGQEELTAWEKSEVDRAARNAMKMGSMAQMMAFLQPPDGNNLAQRLKRWVRTEEGPGPLAWLFDNEADAFDLGQARLNGIDMTHFLRDVEIRTPIMMYLAHRIEELKDGRRVCTLIDEGWTLLDDPALGELVKGWYKLDRRKNACVGLITQSPSDALRSTVARTVVEQTPTKIVLPNNEADRKDYVEGFGLTAGMFDAFTELSPESRRFLVKQGQNGVICELDLSALTQDLAVLTATPERVRLHRGIRSVHGTDPAAWLPVYLNEVDRL
jgi:type IV secretion system protein VirB4